MSEASTTIASEDSWGSDNVSDTLAYLEDIYDELLSYANTQLSSVYMYGGNDGTTTPYTDTTTVSSGTASDIVFDLAGSATSVTVSITDSSGNVVRTLTSSSGTAGTNTIAWDGCDASGNLLSDGTYSFTVSATDASGDAVAEYASYRGDEGGKSVIIGKDSTCTLQNDGSSIFSSALSSISQAITALKNSDYSDDLSNELSDSIDAAASVVESSEVTLSNVLSPIDDHRGPAGQFIADGCQQPLDDRNGRYGGGRRETHRPGDGL